MNEERSSNATSDPLEPAEKPEHRGSRRRPYRRPVVEKKRSVSQATLVTGGGTSGTLAGGSV